MSESVKEQVIDIIVIEDVEFMIIEKETTLYAGSYCIAPDLDSEPDIGARWQFYHDHKKRIADSLTPECMICISINYANSSFRAMIHAQETKKRSQPEGIHVYEAMPSVFIKVNATEASWALTKKLTGEDNPQWHMAPLFGLMKHIFCNIQGDYGYNGNGNGEIEYYYDSGHNGVAVPVKRINPTL